LLEFTRQAGKDRPDVIVAAGGDGTVHYALNALVGYEIPWDCFPLAPETIWPGGSGIARLQRWRRIRFCGHVLRERARAQVVRVARYGWEIICCVKSYDAQRPELRSDKQNFSGNVMPAAVENNVSYGGGIRMTPRACLRRWLAWHLHCSHDEPA
jgi:diacylglycerol kinase family enzyme